MIVHAGRQNGAVYSLPWDKEKFQTENLDLLVVRVALSQIGNIR